MNKIKSVLIDFEDQGGDLEELIRGDESADIYQSAGISHVRS